MIINADFVTVRKSCIEVLLEHSYNCCNFSDRQWLFLQENLSDELDLKRKTPSKLCIVEASAPPLKERRKGKIKVKEWFLRHAPKAKQWHSEQAKIVDIVVVYKAAIQSFIYHNQVCALKEPGQGHLESENGLVAIGIKFVVFTNSSLRNQAFHKRFSYF